jgi:uncharacterized repeat protein (TIGR02059 family)
MYTLSLANITPPVSAFNVQVNSVTMAVISDSIVDGNVRLTMAGAVAYNDIVTISYTAPQENALQTDLGDLATSITNQPVNNYVDAIVSNYINSVVENATPTVIEVSFDSQLADFLPATTSFSVQINNETVQVNSVNIVDGKVQLTLASAVVYGDMVTVSYTRPKTNALQSVSGGVVENLNAQPVTNNCLDVSTKNTPPVVMIKNDAESYSGFVYQIDATGSYDINNDILTFDWILPDSVSASSTNDSKILFLAPMVGASHYFEFMLNVNDGKSIVSKIIPINILPYKPDLYAARITKVEASDFQVPDYPTNAADGTSTTKWSVNGDNQWLTFTLARSFNISYLEIAFLPGQRYESYFDIYASKDNLNWDPILLNASSCNFSGDIQIFDFPTEDINTEYSYVKLIGHGNSLNKLNSYSEIKIIGYIPQNSRSNSSDSRKITIYPNPAQSFFNISLEEPDIEPDTFRIIDSSGRIVFEDSFSKGIKNVQIPNDLSSGIYLIEIGSGTTILDVQKLIINR